MKKFSSAFTLIELMIVVAIIGILAAIAVPLYQGYVSSAQTKRAYAELSAYRLKVDEYLTRGTYPITDTELGYVQSNLVVVPSTGVAVFEEDGSGSLKVTLGGSSSAAVAGTIITINRTVDGDWSCDVDESGAGSWSDYYLPQGCN